MDYKVYHKRFLPHIQPEDAFLFITYRLDFKYTKHLYNTLQESKRAFEQKLLIISKKEEKIKSIEIFNKKQFDKIDMFLPKIESPQWLRISEIAEIIKENLFHRINKEYELVCFCIMPNHVHILIKPLLEKKDIPYSLSKIMHRLKGFTAIECNKILNRTGKFWYPESFDHYIRNENEFYNVINYILQNPVKAGFVGNWKDWKYSWVDEKWLEL